MNNYIIHENINVREIVIDHYNQISNSTDTEDMLLETTLLTSVLSEYGFKFSNNNILIEIDINQYKDSITNNLERTKDNIDRSEIKDSFYKMAINIGKSILSAIKSMGKDGLKILFEVGRSVLKVANDSRRALTSRDESMVMTIKKGILDTIENLLNKCINHAKQVAQNKIKEESTIQEMDTLILEMMDNPMTQIAIEFGIEKLSETYPPLGMLVNAYNRFKTIKSNHNKAVSFYKEKSFKSPQLRERRNLNKFR